MNIKSVVNDVATQVGLSNLTVSLGKKSQLNKIPVHVLSISTSAKKIDTLVTHEEISELKKGELTGYLKIRVEIAVRSLMLPIENNLVQTH